MYYRYENDSSDMYQTSFVLSILKGLRDGYYVELGGGDPIDGNNTALLETTYGWKGVSLDLDRKSVDKYNQERTNPCIEADALNFDYISYFKENNFPKMIDYLQIDIDGHDQGICLLALLSLPMLKYRFKVITIEHDLGQNFKRQSMRDAQREILHHLGYILIGQLDSEDWWVDESVSREDDGNSLPNVLRNYSARESTK